MHVSFFGILLIILLPTLISGFILFPGFPKFSSLNSDHDEATIRAIQKRQFGSDTEPAPGVVIRLTDKLAETMTTEKARKLLMKQFHGLVMPDFKFKALQMNVNVYKTTVAKIESPEIDFKVQSPHSITVKTSGGSAEFRGIYKGTYRTVRDGQVFIDASGLNLLLQFRLFRTPSNPSKLEAKVASCDFSVSEMVVEMKRPLFPQAVEAFKELFTDYLKKETCKLAEEYAGRLGDKLTEVLGNSPLSLKTSKNQRFDDSLIRDPIFDDHSLFFALNGAFNDKEGNERPRVEMFEGDIDRMVYAYISEFTFNEYLKNFENQEVEVVKTRKVERFLALKCEAPCLGSYIQGSDIDSTADLKITFNDAPKIEFIEEGAKLALNLKAEIRLSQEVIISANLGLESMIKRFEIKAQLDDDDSAANSYKLKAEVSVNDMKISNVESYANEMATLAEILPELLSQNKDVIEELLESNIATLFPIETNSYLQVSYIQGFFRSQTLIFAFDLAADGHLIRHLTSP